ncbi:hypothetical protein N2152v2_003031 [Parachlorella kessleri]
MVRTRGTSSFQQQFPLIHALISGDSAQVAALCTPQEAAKQQSSDVRLSEDASALLDQAAAKGQVQVAMHVVKPSPRSVWGLLSGLGPTPWSSYAVERLHPSVATELFAYLAQQLLLGKLELQHLGGLEFLIEAALQAAQPASALLMLQAAQNKQEASQPEQQQEQPQERRQRRQQVQREQLLLSDASLTKLLAVAASMGHAGVVQYLLQQGAAVLPLLLDTRRSHGMALEPWAYTRIDRSVASLLFSHLVQQYADGSLPVLSSRELEKLLREAVRYSQSDACISLLRTAVARLEQAEVAAAASAALREAALHQQPSVVIYVARHYGTSLLWPLFDVGTSTSNAVVHEVVLHVAGQVSSGAMQLDSRRLGLLVSKGAKNHDQEACAAILAAAAQQQVQLTAQDSCMTLQACIRAGCPAELVSLLLRVGDALDSSQLRSLTSRAASYNLGMVLEQLLQAGAAIDPGLVSIAIESLSSSCLAVLLRWGPLPVDTRKPVPHMYTWLGFDYRCPILQVMQELVQLIFSARLPGHGAPVLSLADRVRAQAVCTSWKASLDPRQWPIESVAISDEEQHVCLARWVAAVRPAVRAFVFEEAFQKALFSLLSVAPRAVLEELTIVAEDALAKSFASVVWLFPGLQNLNLEAYRLDSRKAAGLLDCTVFGHMPSLRSLTASGWQRVVMSDDVRLPALSQLEARGLAELEVAGSLPSLQALTVEHVRKVQLDGEGLQLPRLTKLDLESVWNEVVVSWAALPQLGELYLQGGYDPQVDTTGLSALKHLTFLSLGYDMNASGEAADSVLQAAPRSVCDLCISGSRDDWALPPQLWQLTHVTSLASGSVDLIPHLGAMEQLRKLTISNASVVDLTTEYLECLAGLTNLQKLKFGKVMPATLASRCCLQVIASHLNEGCDVEQPVIYW